MIEVWQPVVGYEGLYEVSDGGRVRRVGGGRGAVTGRVLVPAGAPYHDVTLHDRDRGRHHRVHVLVATAFHGPPPGGHQVNHLNGIKTDNRACNLEWVTPSENHLHAFKTGLRVPTPVDGERNPRAILTELDVVQIRTCYAAGGWSYSELAAEFGVAKPTIGSVVRRETWA